MTEEELKKIEEESKEQDNFVFMREEIKSRPINRRKLARNTILAAISAVVFGIVACVTFALIAPFIMDKLSKEQPDKTITPIIVTFPEESQEEEMSPEDMLIASDEPVIDYSQFSILEEEEINNIISSIKFSVSDYQDLYKSLAEIANAAKKSIVRVTPIKTGTDWLNNSTYENDSNLSGLIVADSGNEYYIATRYSLVSGNDTIIVTFDNGIQARTELVNYDVDTDIVILRVSYEDVNELTRNSISAANLGNSSYSNIVGMPIIVVGSPMGTFDSVNYGIITSNSGIIRVTDNYYKQVVTNIYGSKNASGVIINLKGDVLGIIDVKNASSDTQNLICALGISELKKTIERLINNKDIVLLGISGSEVPNEAIMQGTPDGVYVLSVEFDSPAMKAGIQSGDIISKLGGISITRFSDLVALLKEIDLDTTESITVYRSVQDSYKEIELEITYNQLNK